MMILPNATFYNTKTPFSYLNYKTGGTTFRDEDNIKFLYTRNVNKNFNVGTTLDYLYSPGEYNNQTVSRFAGSLFGTYNGKHYNATAFFSTNSLKSQESGGLSDPSTIYSAWARKDLVTNIGAQSNFNQSQIYYVITSYSIHYTKLYDAPSYNYTFNDGYLTIKKAMRNNFV